MWVRPLRESHVSRFEPFVETVFGTLKILPMGEECVSIEDDRDEHRLILTFEEAEELRDILVEITVASRPGSALETSPAPHLDYDKDTGTVSVDAKALQARLKTGTAPVIEKCPHGYPMDDTDYQCMKCWREKETKVAFMPLQHCPTPDDCKHKGFCDFVVHKGRCLYPTDCRESCRCLNTNHCEHV